MPRNETPSIARVIIYGLCHTDVYGIAMIIKIVTNEEDMLAMHRIRQQVFEHEMGLTLPALSVPDYMATGHVIARDDLTDEPVAALTIMSTTSEVDLSEQYGLYLPPSAQTARYMQLAVIKSYRGMNLPLMLILKAHYHFVVPSEFTHTWLLFDAKRAANSSLCARLGFSASERVFQTSFGTSRILVRDEQSPLCEDALQQTQLYLEAVAQKKLHSSQCYYKQSIYGHPEQDVSLSIAEANH